MIMQVLPFCLTKPEYVLWPYESHMPCNECFSVYCLVYLKKSCLLLSSGISDTVIYKGEHRESLISNRLMFSVFITGNPFILGELRTQAGGLYIKTRKA